MGFGDWISNTVDSIGNAGEHLINQGEQLVGSTVDQGAHVVGGLLNDVGAHGAATWVNHAGDTVADHLGAQVAELQLGQTTDPKELIHGDVGAIHQSVGHLQKLAAGFEQTAAGLRGIDTGNWTGAASDAFHAAYPKAPAGFVSAGQACGEAASALSRYADTVSWAQQQAAQAIHLYQQGVHASEQAVASYNQAVNSYNSAVDSYNAATSSGKPPTGLPPTKPAPFHDPGTAMIQQAQHILTNARSQRDAAAATAQGQIAAATQGAPAEPSFHDRMLSDASDLYQLSNVESAHFTGGILKGTGDLVRFARSTNVLDPYNITHPAEYIDNASKTVAGLMYAGNHPATLVKSLVGSGWSSDPAEAAGKLVPNLLLAAATDGGGTAADVSADVGERSVVDLADNSGRLADVARDDHALVSCGDPVDVATGAVFLNQVDLELPGVLPLVLNRRHVSSWRYGRWFGPTWTCTLDERLDIGEDEVMLVRGDGVILTYPHPNVDESVHPRGGARWPMVRTETGGYQVTDSETGQVRHYLNKRRGSVPLAAITDPTGHRIMIVRDERGAPTEVRHTGGYRVLVDTDTDSDIAAGRVTGFTVVLDDGSDPVKVATYEYEDGQLTGVVNASGQPLRFAYDDEGRLTEWADRNGTTYSYVYDEAGRCVRQGGSDGFMSAQFSYTDLGGGLRETVMTDATGAERTYRVNESCQVVEEIDPLGGRTRSSWDERNLLVSRTDPLGRTTRLVRDAAGSIIKVIRPDGSACEITPVSAGGRPQLGLVTDFDGSTWRYSYDDAGSRTSVTDPTGATTRFDYDDHGHLVAVADPLGGTQSIECNGAGLPIAVTDPTGGLTRFSRDGFGRVVEVEDPTGARTRMTWTPEGQLASRTTADGATETYRYDGEGNLVEHTDAGGRVTAATYTHFDLLATQTAPDGTITRYDYDKTLRLTQMTNPQGLTWRYEYDRAGRLVSETDFDGRTQRYTYDAAGQLTGRVNGAGEQIAHEHDLLGRVVRSRAGDQITEFAHDPLGRLLRSTSPGVELVLRRDPAGRVLSETTNGRTLTSTYDAAGRRARRTTPAGVEAAWAYDDAGRPLSVSVAGHEITFGRDQAGHEIHRTLGGRTSLEQVWDPAGRLTTQTLASMPPKPEPAGPTSLAARLSGGAAVGGPSGPTTLQERHYTWQPGGRLSAIDDQLTGARSFELDPIGRITGVIGTGWAEAYQYDPTGNITAATTPGTTSDGISERREYSGTRLLRSGPTRYTYDAQGRLVTKTTKRLSRKPDTWRYAWDAEDRLVSVTTPDGTRWRYLYDGLGRRVAKQRLGPTLEGSETVIEEIAFAWDGAALAEQTTMRSAGPESEAGSTTSWTHNGLAPIAQVTAADGSAGSAPTDRSSFPDEPTQAAIDAEFFSIVTDLVGTPTELIDADGELVWHARRTLWGAPADPTTSDPVPLRFPGQYADPETGLYYNLHRYYDPNTARYASPDPLGLAPAPNPMAYVDNPTHTVDPLGLAPCAPIPDVSTPYGPASQDLSPEALDARSAIQNGAPIYRAGTMGRSQAAEGQFWAFDHPSTPGYASKYGIPQENMTHMDFVEQGRVPEGTPFITRRAPAVGQNAGGGIEVVVPPNGVNLDWFSTLGSEGLG